MWFETYAYYAHCKGVNIILIIRRTTTPQTTTSFNINPFNINQISPSNLNRVDWRRSQWIYSIVGSFVRRLNISALSVLGEVLHNYNRYKDGVWSSVIPDMIRRKYNRYQCFEP